MGYNPGMSQAKSKKPAKPIKPDSKPISGFYRVEFIRPGQSSRHIEAARESDVEKALREMRPKTEYITANVYQYGMPVQVFPRLAGGDWFAAMANGPLAHLAKVKGESKFSAYKRDKKTGRMVPSSE